MKKTTLNIIAIFFYLIFSSTANGALSHDPALTWKTLESDHFSVHFHDGEADLAREAAAVAEKAHARLSRFFNWEPLAKTDLVLSDEKDGSGGFAMAFPHNRTTLFVSPAGHHLSNTDDWLERLIFHEYTHILHMDMATGAPKWLRKVFGRLIPLFPGMLQPAWGLEGLSSYMERNEEYGPATRGPADSNLYDAIMRLETANSIKPLTQVNMSLMDSLSTWPGFLTRYIYGLHFYQFLEKRYGKEAIRKLIEEYSDNLIPFALNSNSRKVLGKDMQQLWLEFSDYLHQRYDKEIQTITAAAFHGEQISHSARTAYSPSIAGNSLYYLDYDGFNHQALMRRRAGKSEKIIDVNSAASIDAHETAGILLTQEDICRNTAQISDLYHVEPETGKMQRLSHCARYIGARWSPDGSRIAAIKNELGRHQIDLLDNNGTFIKTIWQGERWATVSGGDWSPDSRYLVAAIYYRGKGSDLYQFDLQTGKLKRLTKTKERESSPQYTSDGRFIVFAADYGGISNIHRLNRETLESEQLTRVLGGASHPVEGEEKSIYYTSLTSSGIDIYRLARPAALAGSTGSPQTDISPDSYEDGKKYQQTPTPPYSPWYSLRPSWWFPYFSADSDQTIAGISTSGADVLNRHMYNLSFGWDFKNDLAIWSLNYVYDRWYPTLHIALNRTTDFFHDDEGELERIRYEDSGAADLIFPWIKQQHRLALNIGAAWEKHSDTRLEEGIDSMQDNFDNLLGAAIIWDNTHRYDYSISPEDGRRITVSAESGVPLDSDYDGTVYRLDWREYFSITRNHVLAGRLALGRSNGETTPFELGGEFGSGMAGVSEILFGGIGSSPLNVREFPLRGYKEGLAELSGQNMNLGSLEYRFPIKLVERAWTIPPLGIDRVSGTLFAETGTAWDDEEDSDNYHASAGIELKARVSLGYWLPLSLRFGYAHGFDEGGDDRLYLSIGSSF